MTITVDPVNDAPVATADAASIDEDAVLTVDAPGVLANDTDLDGDVLTAVIATEPAHGTVVLQPDGGYTYTPAPTTTAPTPSPTRRTTAWTPDRRWR